MAGIAIRESQRALLRLTAGQAAALQAVGRRLASDHRWWGSEDVSPDRTVVRCEPATDGQWWLTVVDAVGLIGLGTELQISVLPKIPSPHLLYLFSASGRFPKLDAQRGFLTKADSLWELVAEWFMTALEETVRRGLRRDYELERDELTELRGTIEPLASAQAYYAGRIAFACEFDDFNVDTPLNRVLCAAALVILGSPDVSLTLRRRARTMLARMEDVGPLRPADLRARTDRCTTHYSDSLLLAQHVLASTGRTFEGGGLSARTFLIRTPQAVEDGIRHVLMHQLAGVDVVKHGMQLQPTSLRLMPDLLFEQRTALADVKYKLSTGEWKRPDLYQIVTFATGFKIAHAAVIEFAGLESPSVPTLQVGDVQVRHLTWSAQPNCLPTEAAARLVEDVRQWLSAIPRPAAVA